MAMKMACDVFFTTRKVKRYEVIVREVGADDTEKPVEHLAGDLCERALDRLVAKIELGLCPPMKRDRPDGK